MMSPFQWLKAFVKARAKSAFNEGMVEGVSEAAQEFAQAMQAIEVDLPAIADKPTKKRRD